MKKTILIYNDQNSTSAPRVHKQLDALHNEYNLILLASEFNLDLKTWNNFQYVQIPKKDKQTNFHFNYPWILKKSISAIIKLKHLVKNLIKPSVKDAPSSYRKLEKLLSREKIDLIICHHITTLPFSFHLKNKLNIPLILNAHEYYPLQFDSGEKWQETTKQNIDAICLKYLNQLDGMFSVGRIIGEKYRSEFGLKTFDVIPNDKPFYSITPSEVTKPIRLVHHGIAARRRQLENMIEIMSHLDPLNYTLDFMLMENNSDYLNELKDLAKKVPNVKFVKPVKMSQIIPFISSYDIGFYLLPNSNFNTTNALPNKFFEFIQAKLCLCLSPNPEMKSILDKYQLGITAEDYTILSTVKTIQSLDKVKVARYKLNCESYSRELSAETTEKLIRERVKSLL